MAKGVLHHVELYVSDLRKTERFWGWFLTELGYSEFQRWDKGVSWKIGETYIVFVQAEDKYLDVPYHRSRVGLNHLAFHAETKGQVDRLREELAERHIALLYDDRYPFAGGPEHYAVYFEDPDRIKVEVVAPS
ncbi:catechol 2,3-dioxygenase-like lactoylglutathione lyase family enzyme [Pullulanibacillus pueri]|uniref:VOC domain-containing protein n=1 Tax=Pullulanibacillus pueri TaxID=1437324 RepID=A0A8J3EPW6_9BACL|nr:VOC family protein [Pullulanibacillus pueri]MBM7683459.1 catechol 2,3-dioxygenase-like lactoylglutathione lyase family enzyme [Pullulanibacillus pueri]GGH87465.1 hypothetical protein GCM10007096_37550 [Pullulanibacillus pueri]